MACDVFDAFRVATESLSDHIYRLATWSSVWLNLVPRGSWKEGTGLEQTTFTINNIEPTTEDEDWPSIVLATGTGKGACGVVYNEVAVGFDENTYSPEQFGLMGPLLCKDDLIFDHRPDAFLRAYVQELGKRAKRSWEKRFESIYMQIARKVILGASTTIIDTLGKPYAGTTGLLPGASVLTGLPAATSHISQDHLDELAVELIDAGATNPDSSGFISLGDDGPLFSLLIDIMDSQRIAKNNAEFRQDIRWAQPSLLMKRIGAGRTIKNFRHIPTLRPPRFIYGGTLTATTTSANPTLTAVTNNGVTVNDLFLKAHVHIGAGSIPVTGTGIPAGTFLGTIGNWTTGNGTIGLIDAAGVAVNATASGTVTITVGTAGQYTRVPTHIEAAATGKGKKYPINPAYKVAPYTVATVLNPSVFTSESIRPVNSAGGVSWNPGNYMGEWKFITGGEKISATCSNGSDPTEKLGRHFAEFKHAPRPEQPLHGMTIFYKRCLTEPVAVVC